MKKLYKNYLMIICLLCLSTLSTKVNAQHFNFEGGNAVDPVWIMFFQGATLGGIDLEAGDEIAVFDGATMVGAFTLTQVCTPVNFFENDLAAFSTLNSGPGYTPGNPVSFKCWDTSLEIESVSYNITFENPYGDAWTQSVFPPGDGEYSIVNLSFDWTYVGSLAGTITNAENSQPIEGALVTVEGTSHTATSVLDGTYLIEDIEIGNYSVTVNAAGYNPETTTGVEVLACETTTVNFNLLPLFPSQYFNLNDGYQLVSSNLISGNPDMQNIFGGILDNLEFVRNSEGFMLQQIGPVWVNNIGDWINTEGYLIKMSSADQLAITGQAIDPQTPIALTTGYQIIGYLPGQAINTEDVFEDILESLEFVRNTAGFMFQKIGPVWVNNIGDMQPGEGYLVYMNFDNVLIYPASASFTCGDPLTDSRDGQSYTTVLIGDQCWMAENLNIGTMINGNEIMTDNSEFEKYCYENNTVNCDDYGGLYQWNEIMQYVSDTAVQGICPEDWHIPTDYELKILEGSVDSQYSVGDPVWNNTGERGYDAGLNLKSTAGWNYGGNGTDLFGFTALASGFRSYGGIFNYLGDYAYIWSSTEDENNLVWNRRLFYGFEDIGRYNSGMGFGFSVRCLKDEINQPPATPASPNPEDGSVDKSIETDLSWTCTDPDNDPITYDIYLGTSTNPSLIATAQSGTTYDPGTLENSTEYFWKIVARDYYNNITQGPVWSFTTEEEQFACGNPFTDTRDGQTYNSVQIGTQCWMAENINIGTMINGTEEMTDNAVIEKYCYDNNTVNCDEYGGLYQWDEMMQYTITPGVQGICPAGWYIPTDYEWKILEGAVDSQYPVGDPIWNNTGWRGFDAGKNLKSTTGWMQNTGTDAFGFTALPGGYRHNISIFTTLTGSSYFWSSSEFNSINASSRLLVYQYDDIEKRFDNKYFGFSVRCLYDESINQPPEQPSTPNPEDGAVNQSTETDISWTCTDPEGDPLNYDIYFGTEATPPQVAAGQTELTYDPGILQGNTEYFWKIVAHDDQSNSTQGTVWSFTTESWICGNPFIDSRDGQTYTSVQIGDQCWMSENLNTGTLINGTIEMTDNAVIEKYCYENSSSNCDEYGGLYQWNEIMQYTTTEGVQGICPAGWYIPGDDEWKILEGNVDSQYPVGDPIWNNTDWRGFDAGLNLKSATGWNGTDLYGFSALPGGFRGYGGNFSSIDGFALFWSSTEDINHLAWDRRLHNIYGGVARYNSGEGFGFSVRCLKDEINQPPEAPSSPNPDDAAENQTIEVDLSWTCTDPEGNPLTYDIYFGTEASPPQVATGQTETTYDPGTLEYNTECFWKIVAHDDHSNTTEGPVWSFTTEHQRCPGIPTVTYEGQIYNTVLIGDQCWLKENLNIGTIVNGSNNQTDNGVIEKYCYDNDPANCDEYGGLYQWDEMMQYTTIPGVQGLCPAGWHIPTDDEWKILEGSVDSQYPVGDPIWNNEGSRGFDVGLNLKSTSGWISNGNGSDIYGFTTLPGGDRHADGPFNNLASVAYFWSSSEYNTYPWLRRLGYDYDDIYRLQYNMEGGFSVRCLQGEYINQPPEVPSTPSPEHEAVNQSIEVDISWTCNDPEGDPLTYDIYFGTGATPPQVATGQTEITYDPGTLENGTEYFWKIVAHDDHSNTTEGQIWSFSTVINLPPEQAANPSPEHEAENQSIEVDISWTCNDPEGDPLTYDIYFGTGATPPQVAAGQTEITYDPGTLQSNTEYFWKIVAHDDHSNTTEGSVWSFTTGNLPPEQPSNPSPEHEAENQSIEVDLSWTCTDPEGDPLTYDVYFGTETTPPQVATGQSGTTYEPGTLEYNTEYFWKIVAHDDHSNTTEGTVWSFTTIVNLPPESPSTPSPTDGAENQSTEVDLSWTCTDPEGDPLTYDIYFGTEATPPQVATGKTETTYDPGILENNTEYFWTIVAHDNHENTTEGPVWNFTTTVNLPPESPSSPSPNDGAESQSIEVDLSWTCTDPDSDPLTYDIYFGTVATPPQVATGQTQTTYDPGTLEKNTEYFWKIVAHDDHSNTTEGTVWSFTTIINLAPEAPSTPSPEDGVVNQSIDVDLSWTCTDPEGDPLTYDIYFGKEATPPQVVTGQTETTYDPGTLESYIEYFWKIVAHDDHSNTTEGTVWSFNTEAQRCPGIPTVTYEGQVYNTVLIGEQCWLKENLNVGTMINGTEEMTDNSVIEKYCYDNNPAICNEYGGLYQWNEMMQYTSTQGVQGICPAGWNIPTDDEWKTLEGTVDSQYPVGDPIWNNGGLRGYDAGLNLKSISGWYSGGNGTDLYGFTALPGGVRDTDGSFYYLTRSAYFWSSSEYSTNSAWRRVLFYDYAPVNRTNRHRSYGFSARCVHGEYLNLPPESPSTPNPENGAENQSIEVDLSWTCTDPEGDPLTYDIYFGNTATPPQVATGQTETTYNPGTLEKNTEYFWKIVAHDDHSNTTEGIVWNFTTVNLPPESPSNPSPEHEAENQSTEVDLSWTCTDPEGDPMTYDIYFGTEATPPQVAAGQTELTYDPGTLESHIEYFWKIVAHDDHSNTTEGPVWSFITEVACGVPFTDPRDGQTYNTALIGVQCWMAENLNVGTIINGSQNQQNNGTIEKYCYDNSSANCNNYGGLYQWNEMMQYITTPGVQGICPAGWHIPTDAEWKILEGTVDDNYPVGHAVWDNTGWRGSNAGYNLKSASNWNGNDMFGFSALPGGIRSNDGSFGGFGGYAYFYSSSPSGSNAWIRALSSSYTMVYRDVYNQAAGFSVRCLKDQQWQCGNPITDPRDQQIYGTVEIGEQCWIAENLNIGEMINGTEEMTDNSVIEKYCYGNNPAYCDEYGGLYQWNEMMEYTTTPGVQGICPGGWHLPTDGEWTTLTDFLGGESVAGGKMKETGTTHWNSPNTGATNESGFTALPGGNRHANGGFLNLGDGGLFWSSTENYTDSAWYWTLYYNNDGVSRNHVTESCGFSSRCLQD